MFSNDAHDHTCPMHDGAMGSSCTCGPVASKFRLRNTARSKHEPNVSMPWQRDEMFVFRGMSLVYTFDVDDEPVLRMPGGAHVRAVDVVSAFPGELHYPMLLRRGYGT